MTTIAARGGVIACDGRETDDNIVVDDKCEKIWRLPDGSLLGCAGDTEDGQRLYAALKCKTSPPKLDNVAALLIRPSGRMELYEGNIWQRIKKPYYAVGSGAPFAFGAMDAGATAKQAAAIGANRDPNSGGQIQVLRLKR